MGFEVYVKVEGDAVPEWVNVNGKDVGINFDEINKMLASVQLNDLDHYYCSCAGDPDEIKDPNRPEKWFDPREGLEWVQKVKSILTQQGDGLSNRVGVLMDIDAFEVVIRKAAEKRVKWHLGYFW